jgi:hypothetical protein
MRYLVPTVLLISTLNSCISNNNAKRNTELTKTNSNTEQTNQFKYVISNGILGDISIGDGFDSTVCRLEKMFNVVTDSIPECEGCDEYIKVMEVFTDNTHYPLFKFEPGWTENDKNKIFRISTSSSEFATDKGIRIGMTIKDVKAKYEIIEVLTGGETGLHVVLKGFGGSFGVEIPQDDNWWFLNPVSIPDSLRIINIIIV